MFDLFQGKRGIKILPVGIIERTIAFDKIGSDIMDNFPLCIIGSGGVVDSESGLPFDFMDIAV